MKIPLPNIALLCLAMVCLLSGCGTSASLQSAQEAYRYGNVSSAIGQMRAIDADQNNGRDRALLALELGAMQRDAGDLVASNQALANADAAIQYLDNKPEASLSRAALSTVTNLNVLPYEGRNYDRIMLAIYRALNYFELGQFEAGRTELFHAYNRQKEAVERNARRIAKAEQSASETSRNFAQYQPVPDQAQAGRAANTQQPGYPVDLARQDQRFQSQYETIYGDLNRYSAYGDYVNPLAELLQAMVFTHAPLDGADLERGRLAWERAAAMTPGNPYLQADFRLATEISNGREHPRRVFVIFATGVAPSREPVRIDLPLFYFNDKVDYFGAAFPKLAFNYNYQRLLEVIAEGESYPTELVADMDTIIAREFKNELPIIIIKTLIASGTKATLSYLANEATRDAEEEWVNLLVRIAAGAYQYATNQADLRTWASLPKEFQYASLPYPESGKLELAVANRAPIPIDLYQTAVNVIFVRSISPEAPLSISIFNLPQT